MVKLWAVWNDIERKPDHFVFDDLDRLTELAGKNGLKVIINTIPEGAPYWLYEAHPDCLYETVEGKKLPWAALRTFRQGDGRDSVWIIRKFRIWCVISSSVLRSITVTTAV